MMQRCDLPASCNHPSIYAFQKSGRWNKIDTETDLSRNEKSERMFICVFCGKIITAPSKAISINGSHSHTFTNPAGITFTIGCFDSAEGCYTTGESTREHTWFPGFSWDFALCRQCQAHMGWQYFSEGFHFYGIILKHITESI